MKRIYPIVTQMIDKKNFREVNMNFIAENRLQEIFNNVFIILNLAIIITINKRNCVKYYS